MENPLYHTWHGHYNKAVVLIMRSWSTPQLCLRSTWHGYYNKVVLLTRPGVHLAWVKKYCKDKSCKLLSPDETRHLFETNPCTYLDFTIIIVFSITIQFPSFNDTTTTFIAVSTRALPFDTYQVQCEASNSHGTSSASVNFVIVQLRFDGKHINMDIEYVVRTSHIWSSYVTGFAKRGLPHTSNCTNLEDHNFVIKWHMKLKLSPAINLCVYFLLTKFQVDSFYQSNITNRQSW